MNPPREVDCNRITLIIHCHSRSHVTGATWYSCTATAKVQLALLHISMYNVTTKQGKVMCATKGHVYRHNFSDQLIKEQTGHRSLEALQKYKRTGSDQQ